MIKHASYEIRQAASSEYQAIGDLLVKTYSSLEGFPTSLDQPAYFQKLQDIHLLLKDESMQLLVAATESGDILGTVLFFGDMHYYGSRGAPKETDRTAGFRFLGVEPSAQGRGVGKALSMACIDRAKMLNAKKLIIHSTDAMKTAQILYESLGFKRTPTLDFSWDGYGVYGFELPLDLHIK